MIVAGLPSVDLRVLPGAAPSPLLPLADFSIHDDEILWFDTLTREIRSTGANEIAAHTRAFALAREAAAAGADAVELIRRVLTELSSRHFSTALPPYFAREPDQRRGT